MYWLITSSQERHKADPIVFLILQETETQETEEHKETSLTQGHKAIRFCAQSLPSSSYTISTLLACG